MDDVFRIGGIYNFEKFKFEAKVSQDRIFVMSLIISKLMGLFVYLFRYACLTEYVLLVLSIHTLIIS